MSTNAQQANTSVFTPEEIAYLSSQRLGRLATVGANGQPHVVPVAFRYNPETDTIDLGGHRFAQTKKYRDAIQNPRVAFVVDDVVSVEPWTVRMIEIRGESEVLESGGESILPGFAPQMLRLRPRRIISFGMGAEQQSAFSARSVE